MATWFYIFLFITPRITYFKSEPLGDRTGDTLSSDKIDKNRNKKFCRNYKFQLLVQRYARRDNRGERHWKKTRSDNGPMCFIIWIFFFFFVPVRKPMVLDKSQQNARIIWYYKANGFNVLICKFIPFCRRMRRRGKYFLHTNIEI